MSSEDLRKLVIVVASIVLLVVILFFLLPALTRGKGSITINTIPNETNIVFDGKDHKSSAKITDITSGRYTIEISKDGYKTRVDEVSIVRDKHTEVTLRLYSSDTSPTAIGTNVELLGKQQSDLEKLAVFLPFSNERFRIEAKIVNKKPTVEITLYAILNKPSQFENFKKQIKAYSDEALKWIKSKDADPENLDIKWEPIDPKKF